MYYPIGIRYMPPLCLSGERFRGCGGEALTIAREERVAPLSERIYERHKEQEYSKSGRRKRRAVSADGTQRRTGQNQRPRVDAHARAMRTTRGQRAGARQKQRNTARDAR